jgi:hypothetical protein
MIHSAVSNVGRTWDGVGAEGLRLAHLNPLPTQESTKACLTESNVENFQDLHFLHPAGPSCSHKEYSLLAKLLFTSGGFSFAAAGVCCFVVHFTYFRSIVGFVGMIVALLPYLQDLGIERFDHHAKGWMHQRVVGQGYNSMA